MFSTRYDNARLQRSNWKLFKLKSFCTLSISEKKLNATKFRIQHQPEKWYCVHNDHSSIDHTIAAITSNLVISPEQFRSLAKRKIICLVDQFLAVEYNTKNPFVVTDGSTSVYNGSHCTPRYLITSDTFPPHMQRTTLKVRMSPGKGLPDSAPKIAMCTGRVGLPDNLIGSVRLPMELTGQLCLVSPPNRIC